MNCSKLANYTCKIIATQPNYPDVSELIHTDIMKTKRVINRLRKSY